MGTRRTIKRIMRSIVIATIMAMAALCLFACNHTTPNNNPNYNPDADPCANGHKFSQEWSYDSSFHWHAAICEHTDEKSDYNPHSYNQGSDICSDCGYSRTLPYTFYLTFKLERGGGSYSVMGSKDASDTIVIPSEYNGLPVTRIENFGFQRYAKLKKIVIPDSVTDIGIHTFSGCSALEDVTLPNSITEIGGSSFFACTSLVNINIPESVTTISDQAFSGCRSMLSFTVNDRIKYIHNYAFRNCVRLVEVYNLSTLDIQCGSTDHGEIALHARVVHTTTDAESRVAQKDGFLYYSDDNVASLLGYSGDNKDVVLPENLGGNPYTINTRAFENSDITSVEITSGVTSIDNYAFYNCASLESVELDGVQAIGDYAFGDNKNLSSVRFSDSLETIGEYAFLNCSALTELNVPDSVIRISTGAFAYCSKLEKLTVPFVGMEKSTDGKYDSDHVFGIIFGYTVRSSTGNGVLQYWVQVGTFKTDYYMYHIPDSLSAVTITGDCVVPSNAFRSCYMIKNLDMSACTVNEEALSQCYGLEHISVSLNMPVGKLFGTQQSYGTKPMTISGTVYYVPETLRSVIFCGNTVPYNALYGFEQIENVQIADTVNNIGSSAFYGCSGLEEIDIPSSVITIDGAVFCGCSSLKSVAIPSGVTFIGNSLFYNCSELTEVELPDSLENIYLNTFYGCNKLTTVNIPSSLKSIGDYAFFGTAISSVRLPVGLLTIGRNAFNDCDELTAVYVPDTVTSIGIGAFSGCNSITEITVPFIGDKLYDNAQDQANKYTFGYIFGSSSNNIPTALKHVTVTGGVIFDRAFSDCSGLTEINIPSDITAIGSYAFYNCASLKRLVVPSGVTEIGEYAFYGLNAVEHNEYQNGLYIGSEENKYMVLCGVKDKTSATFTINDNTLVLCEEAISGMTALTTVDCLPFGVKRLPEKAIFNCSALTDITIPGTVQFIAQGAISGCNKLADITLPYLGDMLKTDTDDYRYPLGYIFGIDKYPSVTNAPQQEYYRVNGTSSAYYSIPKSLRSVTVNDGVVSHGAFMNCSFLTEVTMPSALTEIGDKAFYGCSGLLSIDFPSAVVMLGVSAFSGCSALETVNVNDILQKIGNSAFYKCTSLTEIMLPNTVDGIGHSVFYGCTSLVSFDMPTYVPSLCARAFYGCTALETVSLGNIANTIGSNAFYGCKKLGSISIPSGVTEIGETAFSGCSALGSITFDGNAIKVIGIGAFSACKALEAVSLPSSVETIAINAFNGCTGIKTVTFGSNVKYIGAGSFTGCNLITSLTIPDSVTEIGSGAFRDCDGLQTLTLPFVGRSKTATLPYEQVFGHIFGYYTDESSLKATGTWQLRYNNLYYYYYIPTSLTNVTVNGGYVNDSAFRNCASLTTVTLGANVTGIGSGAFMDTKNLTTITFVSTTGWTYAGSLNSDTWTNVDVTASDFVTKIKKASNSDYGNKYFKHTV